MQFLLLLLLIGAATATAAVPNYLLNFANGTFTASATCNFSIVMGSAPVSDLVDLPCAYSVDAASGCQAFDFFTLGQNVVCDNGTSSRFLTFLPSTNSSPYMSFFDPDCDRELGLLTYARTSYWRDMANTTYIRSTPLSPDCWYCQSLEYQLITNQRTGLPVSFRATGVMKGPAGFQGILAMTFLEIWPEVNRTMFTVPGPFEGPNCNLN